MTYTQVGDVDTWWDVHDEGRPLAFHMDGQLAHAVERAIGGIVRSEGLRMAWRPAPARLLPADAIG